MTIANLFLSIVMVASMAAYKFQPPEPPTIEEMAAQCNLTVSEFELISAVTEAESNRSTDGDLTGRIFIAATIFNRINSSYFPNDAVSVLTQRNQFSTVRNGQSITARTQWSDAAVVEAYEMLQAGEIPDNILFFNCIGFNNGTPFRLTEGQNTIGGNYFMQYGPEGGQENAS